MKSLIVSSLFPKHAKRTTLYLMELFVNCNPNLTAIMNCYICGEPSTSDEHAPARGFFPKGKRNQLITVRSCAKHNEDTSKDDEYVRNVIVMSLGNNTVALDHFKDKGISSFNHSPALMVETTGVRKTVLIQEKKDELTSTYALKIDRKRIDFILSKIAYALFFWKYKTPWNRALNIATEFLLTEDQDTDDLLSNLIQEAKEFDHLLNYEGTNPDIFQFVFISSEETDPHDQILRLKFYEGFEAWILPISGSDGPLWEKP
ncbi:MAG TPA: hypothetical protein VKB19_18740 [Pedobacter sp.]|nr:hypothetical protein [Pedobacter sp.]